MQLKVERTDRQRQAWAALERSDVRRLLYGGAKGGGKSYFLCVWAFMYCWDLCVRFKLMPSINPIHAGWIGRKLATDFTATTLQTWRKVIPEQYYQLKSGTEKDSKHILIMDRIAIDYGGLDRQESVNKFNSAEYAFFCIDQAEKVDKDDISVLKGSLRLTIDGQKLSYRELYTANPRACWLRDEFIMEPIDGNVFVPALPKDNPHLPDDYTRTLIDAFGYRPELLAAYMDGDWSQIEDEAQVIRDIWLQRAINAVSIYEGKLVACDPARFGDDMAEIMVLNGTQIEHQESMAQSRTTKISSRLVELSRQNGNCPIIVDSIGVGAGVEDELYAWGRNVIPFNSSEKALDEKKYYNKRAEAWWECSKDLAQGNIGCSRMTVELRRDLCSPTYTFRNGRILIEPKEQIKERLKRSPGKGDCYTMGVWGVKNMMSEPIITNIGPQTQQSSYNYDPLDARKL